MPLVKFANEESCQHWYLYNHAPQQRAICLAFHQQAADELGGNLLGGAGEEGLGEGWEVGMAMGVAWVNKGDRFTGATNPP